MKKIYIFLFVCVAVLSAVAQTTPNLYRAVDKEKMNHWVDSVFDAMSYDERIGQLFMVIANPKSDTRNMQRLMRYVNEIKIGGILFHKGDPVTQAEVTNRLQKASRVPMLVSLDGEWGLSMRLSGTTRFPKNMMLGAIEDNSLITEYGKEVARQCKEMGIHINFAPDMDVNSNTDNPARILRRWPTKGLRMPVGWKGRASCLSPSISPDMAIPPKIPIIRCLPFIMTGHAWTVWSCCLSNVTSMTAMPA